MYCFFLNSKHSAIETVTASAADLARMYDQRHVAVHHRRKLAERADDNILSVESVHSGRRRRCIDTQHELQVVDNDVSNVMNIHRM